MSKPRASEAGAALALLLVGVSLGLAAFDGTSLETPRLSLSSGPLAIPAAELGCNRAGGRAPLADGALRLYANRTLSHRIELPGSARVPLQLVARGSAVDGIGPYVELHVDGRRVEGFHVPSESWSVYRIPVELPRGEHLVEWSFVNDATSYPEARDLDVLLVTVGSPAVHPAHLFRWQAPCRVDPARLAFRDYGQPGTGGFRLWNGGSIGDDVVVTTPGRHAVRLQLRAGSAGTLHFAVDGLPTQRFELVAGEQQVVAAVELAAGLRRLEWRYQTERRAAEADHDLLIESVSIGEPATVARSRGALPLAHDRVAVDGADVELRSSGTQDGRSWALWSNGHLIQSLSQLAERPWLLRLSARADLCRGRGPRLLVSHDADQLARLPIDSTVTRDFVVPLPATTGRHRLALVYDDDLRVPGECDRNLYVERLAFEPVTPEGPDAPDS